MGIFNVFNSKLSNYGEHVAVKHLKSKGYKILERNYRLKFGEIDIIASRDDVISIIEVKQRATDAFSSPREAVDKQKQEKIKRTALYYITKNNIKGYIRFDVIEVVGKKNPEIVHIKSAFV